MKTSIKTILLLMILAYAGQAISQVVTITDFKNAVPGGDAIIEFSYDPEGSAKQTMAIVINFQDLYSNVAPSDLSTCNGDVSGTYDCLWLPDTQQFQVQAVNAGTLGIGAGVIARLTFTIKPGVALGTKDNFVYQSEFSDFANGTVIGSDGSGSGSIDIPEGPQPVWGDEFNPVVISSQVGTGTALSGFNVNNDAGEDSKRRSTQIMGRLDQTILHPLQR